MAVKRSTSITLVDSASGRVASATKSDSLWHDHFVPDSILYSPLGPDTYAVAIARPGYQQWLRSGIVVAADGSCLGFAPVNVTPRLQPSN